MPLDTTLVLGATGKSGRRIVARLRLRGTPVRAASRSSETVDLEDVADVAAMVLTEPGRHAGKVYELTGPRGISFPEAVDTIARTTGLPIRFQRISPVAYTAALVGTGFPEDLARAVTTMFRADRERGHRRSRRRSRDAARTPARDVRGLRCPGRRRRHLAPPPEGSR